ncbi:hypothetical protein [Flavobacterium sp. 3HN19-14]|uniref:hypothetical protein n=1 Tax=Flavobacterium sp. 3HN19-14 TaxID=3448133 RepID=UPI003EE3A24B
MNITISNNHLTAVINPKGAELISLKNTAGKEFIWEGNPDFWASTRLCCFRLWVR